MTDVVLEYPEDVELIFRQGRLVSLQILDVGWDKLVAAGWPAKGNPIPMNITLEQLDGGRVTVTVWATKH